MKSMVKIESKSSKVKPQVDILFVNHKSDISTLFVTIVRVRVRAIVLTMCGGI